MEPPSQNHSVADLRMDLGGNPAGMPQKSELVIIPGDTNSSSVNTFEPGHRD